MDDSRGRAKPGAPSGPPVMRSGTIPVFKIRDTPFCAGEVVAGRYVVERVLAEGGVGVVLAAHHLELEEPVAIKFLKPELAAERELIGRFAREAKACARIRSEHTPTIIDVGVSAERGPYIVMEYLEGEDLEHVLATRGPLDVTTAVELMVQTCEALAAAHARGIIHRDLKPENLFLTRRGHGLEIIKVLDFGISKVKLEGNVFGGAASMVRTQNVMGSPLYMSPEQLRGKTEAEPTTDIWSLGAVLYELLGGRTAFEGTTVTEVCASVLETEPPPLSELRAGVPPGLEAVIARCLAKEPAARFPNVAELAVALAPFAPKRARLNVERAIAIARAAGLAAEDLRVPDTLPPSAPPPAEPEPPSMSSRDPNAPEPGAPATRPDRPRSDLRIQLLAAVAAGAVAVASMAAWRILRAPAEVAPITVAPVAPLPSPTQLETSPAMLETSPRTRPAPAPTATPAIRTTSAHALPSAPAARVKKKRPAAAAVHAAPPTAIASASAALAPPAPSAPPAPAAPAPSAPAPSASAVAAPSASAPAPAPSAPAPSASAPAPSARAPSAPAPTAPPASSTVP